MRTEIIYLVVLIVLILIFQYLQFTWIPTLVIAMLLALLFISPLVDVRPAFMLDGRGDTVFYYMVCVATGALVIGYALYMAVTAPRKNETNNIVNNLIEV